MPLRSPEIHSAPWPGALGLAFDEGMASLDMAILLAPPEREMAEAPAAIDSACELLTAGGATAPRPAGGV
jgi:hypothetical protein